MQTIHKFKEKKRSKNKIGNFLKINIYIYVYGPDEQFGNSYSIVHLTLYT